jgi:glycine dehydrogenase subunit 2
MRMNRQGRPTSPERASDFESATFSGDRGLEHEEPLIFEIGDTLKSGVDLPEPLQRRARLAGMERRGAIGLPGLSEPETVRHYVRMSRNNYAIDTGVYPLGSCTMKHNPRLGEAIARIPGLADIHPLQPQRTVAGALEVMNELSRWLLEITGMSAIALSPKAGAHGELAGLLAIRAAHEAKGEKRDVVLVPESAHGTNPASATLAGLKVKPVGAQDDGTVSAAAVREALAPEVAGIMLTNPNTCGLFEREIGEIADAVHRAGAYFYCDGANLNAIMGKVRLGDLGVDAMHLNLHKTFSTPHGGGGPGSGPVVFSKALAPFAPLPFLVQEADGPGAVGFRLVESGNEDSTRHTQGRIAAFHGQMGMFVRALAFMMSHGATGLRQAAEDAVLNANYVRAGLSKALTQSFTPAGTRPCMHEVLFDDRFLKGTGVTTLDFSKAMIDEGFHPMTMYFPLVVQGALLIEPTESESKASLDKFVATLRALAEAARGGDTERFVGAPHLAPTRRLDETKAAREPRLVWRPQPPAAQ